MGSDFKTNLRADSPDLRRIGLSPNYWYPLAIAKDLKKGKVLAVSFAGEPIVLVRTHSDRLYALEDRCAHRQIPLSKGAVVGECLQCCYHAWTYNEFGECVSPKQAASSPISCGVRSYPTRQAFGLIFVFPGDPEHANLTPLPIVDGSDSNRFVAIYFARHMACHYSFMHENLMDMSHQFLHRRWMGKFRPVPLAHRKDTDRVEVDYSFDVTDGSLAVKSLLPIMLGLSGGKESRRNRSAITISTHYPYQNLLLRHADVGEPLLRLWIAYVPSDREQRTNKQCGVLFVRKPGIPWLISLLRPIFEYYADAIFEEDRIILEAEQKAYDMQGCDRSQEVLPFIIDLRHLLIDKGVSIQLDSPVHAVAQ